MARIPVLASSTCRVLEEARSDELDRLGSPAHNRFGRLASGDGASAELEVPAGDVA